MALGEQIVQRGERTPEGYAAKVRWLAAIYVALNVVSITVVVLVCWRIRHLITLAQRSNVETLVLAIVVVLAVYYVASTFRGLIGGVRILVLNAPKLWARDARPIERRKHRALRSGGDVTSVCLDKIVRGGGKAGGPIAWELADTAGKLGDLTIEGAVASFQPMKDGINASLFEFLVEQINLALRPTDPAAAVTITFWANIDEEASAAYRSTVGAFENLARHLESGPLWPSVTLTKADVAAIDAKLTALVPALRNEMLLPDVEYQVEYSVPILPEPLAFVQLRREERRADPVLTMGYAVVIMSVLLVLVIVLIVWPPWVPSK